MNRRDLLKAMAMIPFGAATIFGQRRQDLRARRIIKPKRLRAGETVAIIAPSSGVSAETFDKAVQKMQSLGFRTKEGVNARKINGFLAGTDKERLADLHQAFADKEVDAVFCVRGGYGASRLLSKIDYNLIRRNPKIFVGFSDITALHLAIAQNTGLVTFHGAGAASINSEYTEKHLLDVLMNPVSRHKLESSAFNTAQEDDTYKTRIIRAGKSSGRLVGGNLSLLAALAGTPFGLKSLRGKMLFIEDVNERPYRLDRMLTQLRQSADFRGVSGVAIGICDGCDVPRDDVATPTAADVFKERLGDLGVPVIYGLSFGHIREQFTLPVGIQAQMNTADVSLTLLEPAVL
jgi:muramoyltetrapeptide carboxypeptidase